MYNKELFEKIISASCSNEELVNFNKDIDKQQFDLDNAFEKYYSLKSIVLVISKYENNKISEKFLSNWMNAYNWIIMAGFNNESKNIDLKEWVKLEISDWLDCFSFYDKASIIMDMNEFKDALFLLDEIYKNVGDWKCIFAHTDRFGDNEDDVVLLIVNAKLKRFIEVHTFLDYLNLNVDFTFVNLYQLENEVKTLKNLGFTQLIYGDLDDE